MVRKFSENGRKIDGKNHRQVTNADTNIPLKVQVSKHDEQKTKKETNKTKKNTSVRKHHLIFSGKSQL